MFMNKNVLIIPDIHGRSFWKDAVKGREDWKIVFLGDYLDPYPSENITHEDALNNFKEILAFKKAHNENVTLLIGNHDCTYAIPNGEKICFCRTDVFNFQEISSLFKANFHLFSIVDTVEINKKQFVFSHAPILKHWYDKHFQNTDVLAELQKQFKAMTINFVDALADIDLYRGGYAFTGSIVWADVCSLLQDNKPLAIKDAYSIFGHTQLKERPIIMETYACLDCRKAFILNENGLITDLNS